MSYENPTHLRLGMQGNFGGKDYRVAGRSVMGEQEDGETYFWNEFNLETNAGESATLVFEETERGNQWRLFTMFEPEYPMTAAAAASMNVGDRLNLTADEVRVTFRGFSEVYYVEGKGPEGEAIGKVAEYFNAEAGSIMQVVSWTGEEVEYYNGVNLTRGIVASAFKLPLEPEVAPTRSSLYSSLSGSNSSNYLSGLKFSLLAGFVVVLFLIIFGRGFLFSSGYEGGPVKKMGAPDLPLAVGAGGTLSDKHYRVTSHAVVEVAEVGVDWQRHEYELTDDSGGKVLLVCGIKPDGVEWVLFEPFFPSSPLTAKEAAAKQVGDLVDLNGYSGTVVEIFASTVQHNDGEGATPLQNGMTSYGFRSNSEYRTLLARWSEAGIQFYRGQVMTAKKGLAGFATAK